MSSSGTTLFQTIQSLAPDYRKLLSPNSGGFFLRYDEESTTWTCNKKRIPSGDKDRVYRSIVNGLVTQGMKDFPSFAEMSLAISRINSFFTKSDLNAQPSHFYLQEHEYPQQPEIRFSATLSDPSEGYEWLSTDFPSLIVDEDGVVYPTASHHFDQQRKVWCHPHERAVGVDTTKTACKVRKAVDSEVTTFLCSNPQERDYDHGVVGMMQKSLGFKFDQNPVLMKALEDTGDARLSCVVAEYPWQAARLAEFDEGGQGPLFGLAECAGGLRGRNWVGLSMKEIREKRREVEV